MTLITTNSHQGTTIKTSKMQSGAVSNRVILGIAAFSVSFGLSLVPNWDITQALITGIITVLATYSAALFVDKRRRNYELLVLNSLHRKIRELEGLKYRIVREIQQVEQHKIILYTESQNLQNQIIDSRNQRDSIHRDLGSFAAQKKQLEVEILHLKTELEQINNNTAELKQYCSDLAAEKRRLEVNCNVSRAEVNQTQAQIEALKQEKQEIENNLILSNRLKPQLEEKLHELRVEVETLETKIFTQTNSLQDTIKNQEVIANNIKKLQENRQLQTEEINQLQNQISLLQDERDSLQNEVWELLQNLENLSQEQSNEYLPENEIELFPFDELLEVTEPHQNSNENLPPEWNKFLDNVESHQIKILKAIVQQDDTKAVLKQIAETQITMPNLLIDSINEIADNTIGELILETSEETPEIYPEHLLKVREIIKIYDQSVR
ncbi:tellurite resistance TerB C-terminal domain-containing protein [Okeanomitos corallinicola TIOX110]|uniref:Tellurite resistance TerB C-terminal domain-containing protein n=1 Tax=Okeanomitos corallinicola TIOX110 TaxID=3133117 RepID=A0ABZ2UN91_9CYAN